MQDKKCEGQWKNKKKDELSKKLQQDPYNVQQCQVYAQRSYLYELQEDYESAIIDLSKSLYMQPNCEGYIKRGKLYASSEMFYCSLMDFEEAHRLYHEEKNIRQDKYNKNEELKQKKFDDEKNTENGRGAVKRQQINAETESFLENSTVILKLEELKKIVKDQQVRKNVLTKDMNSEFNKMMGKIIDEKINAEVNLMKQQNENYQKLLQIVRKQEQRIKQLQQNLSNKMIDYEHLFYKQMQQSTMLPKNKQKFLVYFSTVVSQMQKYYLSAKVLAEFDEKISFSSFHFKGQEKTENKNLSACIAQKIFKLFEKHESKIERVGQLVKQVPYVGSVFKLIKSSLKVCGWVEEVKGESECENILGIRPSITSFNKLSGKVAYEMCKYFKMAITTETKRESKSQIYNKSCFDKLTKILKKFKRNQIGARIFKHIKTEEKNSVEQIARVHASILMAGIAYGIIALPSDNILDRLSEETKIFDSISQIQEKLLLSEADQDIEQQSLEQKQNEAQQSKRTCLIF